MSEKQTIKQNQSKHRDAAGVLRYDVDGSEVFPGATGKAPERVTIMRPAAEHYGALVAEHARLNAIIDITERQDRAGALIVPLCYLRELRSIVAAEMRREHDAQVRTASEVAHSAGRGFRY